MGVLSWLVEEGVADGVDLSGLPVALALRYSDDEPGSPWRWALYLDERADEATRAALADVWRGTLGGTPTVQFPWARKPSTLLDVAPARIELDHTPGRCWLRIGRKLTLTVEAPFPTSSTVTCLIPGHDRPGREVVASTLEADDGHFQFRFQGVCGYESTFHYASG